MEKTLEEMILEILMERRATVRELSDEIGWNRNSVRTFLHKMKMRMLVLPTGKYRRRFQIWELFDHEYEEEIEFWKKTPKRFIDTNILKKMILPFAKKHVIVKLSSDESSRIKELTKMTYDKKGERIDGR